jgi:hypothetical protein
MACAGTWVLAMCIKEVIYQSVCGEYTNSNQFLSYRSQGSDQKLRRHIAAHTLRTRRLRREDCGASCLRLRSRSAQTAIAKHMSQSWTITATCLLMLTFLLQLHR